MNIFWTPRAASDLNEITESIGQDRPDAAFRIRDAIYNRVEALDETPEIGRIGEVQGTLELVCNPWPYIVVYAVARGSVRVLLIRGTSQPKALIQSLS